MAISDGDILSALSELRTDTSNISNTLSDMSEKDIHQIQLDLSTLVRMSQGTRRSSENDRFQRERDERNRDRQNSYRTRYSESNYRTGQRSSQGTTRSSFNRSSNYGSSRGRASTNPFKGRFDGVIDEFFGSIGDGIKGELKKSLADSPFHKQIKGYIQKFAKDLGIEVSEIPSVIGKDLGKHLINNTKVGQTITSTLRGFEDRILGGAINGAKRSTSEYAKKVGGKNATFKDVYEDIVSKYNAEHAEERKAKEAAREGQHVPPQSDRSESPDTLITLVTQINDSVLAILNHYDSDAADRIKDSANKSQGKGKKKPGEGPERPEGPEGENPDIPEASNIQKESQRPRDDYNPDLDLINKAKEKANKAKGLYDKYVPDSIKSKIGQYTGKLKDLSTGAGSKLNSWLGNLGGDALSSAGKKVATTVGQKVGNTALGKVGGQLMSKVGGKVLTTVGSKVGGTALAGTLGGAGASAGMGAAAGALSSTGYGALIVAAIYVVSKKLKQFAQCFTPAIEGLKKFKEAAKKASDRFYTSQKEMIKTEQERIEADVKTMAEAPFKIMEEAAQKWYDAWDNHLKTIGQTQGYTKADVQTLFSSYAERLRSEGLSSIISAADISSSLGSVIESGLSGKAAEEFAYQATLLNNAIPYQDFFSYSDTYAQIVGNALARGLSESSAIQEANNQLQQFASNLLYADRQISSGVSTAMKDGAQLFADAVKIANTARTGDSTKISGVLTAVAAQVGAIAPDLASDIVSNVVQAAVGGNSSDLVALRSMAGIGASNTAFIKALAESPQQVFASLFANLANMQKLNNDNYMEVAESLSETFGISASAFARIDFSALAQAISSMQVNQAALSENLSLLKSGETTQGTEMLKMQQINQMIIDEGLAYVLDNEAARQIQQHMWDQELANEIMEREYSVDFAGSAKEMIEGIFETIHNILKFLNPFSWIGSLVNIVATGAEYDAQKADLRAILEAGKVGQGNATAFRNLTNYNGSSLNSVPTLMEMMGLFSSYSAVHGGLNLFNSLTDVGGSLQLGSQALGSLGAAASTALTSYQSSVNSKYTWGFVGKSLAKAIANSPMSVGSGSGSSITSSSDAIRQKEAEQMNQILDSMDAAVEANKSFDQWKDEVTKQYKLSNFGDALSGVGLSEAEARGQFEAKEAQKVSKHNYEREQVEDEFWDKAINYFDNSFPEFAASQLEKMDIQIDWQNKIYDELVLFHTDNSKWWETWIDTTWKKEWVETTWKKEWITTQWINGFLNYWTDIFVKFDTYSKSTHNAYKAIDEVKDKDKKKESGDAVLALAKALTDNTAELRDPTIQTNALLAQILIVAEAILQSENTSGGASLQTSLSALGLGLTTSDTTTGTDTNGTTTSGATGTA